ncbi:MAG: phosphonopyruvate decarboxylase [Kordiimonadaceae bacterium]|jgi:phosphonopyruvate decarboxylase|nr:phosphonopyruvate decarboxylase [Kordiimonadaceae bacterium]
MISSDYFIDLAIQHGYSICSGVPCSYLKPFINGIIDSARMHYVSAANEGDAIAIASGATIGGGKGIAVFQNSGLGNAVSPITSLCFTFKIPVLIIVTLRGEPGGAPDEPQHELMGQITTQMLDVMRVSWEYFPNNSEELALAMDKASKHMDETGLPYAFVMKKNTAEPRKILTKPIPRGRAPAPLRLRTSVIPPKRFEALTVIQKFTNDDIVLASTGVCGRELFALDDRLNQLYMVGSMGCISSLGLGLAIQRPDNRIVVIDGDGACLMRLGALTTIGYEQPNNLIHILLDNNLHESTGGQSTVAHSVDFSAIATASSYPKVNQINDLEQLSNTLQNLTKELTFIDMSISAGLPENLPRPNVTPHEVSIRLKKFMEEN